MHNEDLNGLTNVCSSAIYEINQQHFIDLDPFKSIEININFDEYAISLNPVQTAGTVSGIDPLFNNYCFDDQITLVKSHTLTSREEITANQFEKSKPEVHPFILQSKA